MCGSVGNGKGNATVVGTRLPVTVNVRGVYPNDRPSLTHSTATTTGAAGVAAGIESEPCHEPSAATDGLMTVCGTVVAVTVTVLRMNPVQPVPLTFTVVPTGPEPGDMLNDVGRPSAPAFRAGADAQTTNANAIVIAATLKARPPVAGTRRNALPGNSPELRSRRCAGMAEYRPDRDRC